MFNFHKPKVYRSTTGCCICKAKSSSSRFTDSKKYEEDFIKCFKLVEPRKGEICNACVLLVKRFKKLPPGSERNWKHVVDARAGPGMKSMSKFKSKSKKVKEEQEKRKKKHHHHSSSHSHHSTSNGHHHLHQEREGSPVGSDGSLDGNDDALMAEVKAQKSNLRGTDDEQKIALETNRKKRKVEDEFMICDEENQSGDSSSRTPSPGGSDSEDMVQVVEERGRRRKSKPVKRPRRDSDDSMEESGFIDKDYWKKEMTCCGLVYRGLGGETMVDVRFHKPCKARLAMMARKQSAMTADGGAFAAPSSLIKEGSASPEAPRDPSMDATVISDSSSDSGYDESSNQGVSPTVIAATSPSSSSPSPNQAAAAQATTTKASAFVDSNKNVCITDSSTDCLNVGQINDKIKIITNNN